MISFFKFTLKCILYGSFWFFSTDPAEEKLNPPIDDIGVISFGIFAISFVFLREFFIKRNPNKLRKIIGLSISFAIVLIYYIIVYYCFVPNN